ncbi:MAG: hypothetical protein AABO58_19025 [Acidobacteriota bacterium]
MRGPLPLHDADFAAIRAQVMAKIETPRRAPVAWRFAYVSVMMALLSVIVFVQTPPAVAPPPGVRASRPHPTAVPAVGIMASKQPEKPQRRGTRRRSGRDARTPPQVARIELQTADPDVRIIWITN